MYRRLREESPLYYNSAYDFYAISRFDDVNRAIADWETFSSSRGAALELIKANIEIPSGALIFQDPPIHDIYRKLLSRMFTPRKINALEHKIREFCGQCLDPLVGSGRLDFVADLGAQMPMRVIGIHNFDGFWRTPATSAGTRHPVTCNQHALGCRAPADTTGTPPGDPSKFRTGRLDLPLSGRGAAW